MQDVSLIIDVIPPLTEDGDVSNDNNVTDDVSDWPLSDIEQWLTQHNDTIFSFILNHRAEKDKALAYDLAGIAPYPSSHIWEASLKLSDDDGVKALNRDFRGKDKATNILSFSALEQEADGAQPVQPDHAPMVYLGDMIMAFETLEREAEEQGKSFEEHFMHLTIHGLLHLLGHDHHQEHEAILMEAIEADLMLHLGYNDPYEDMDSLYDA